MAKKSAKAPSRKKPVPKATKLLKVKASKQAPSAPAGKVSTTTKLKKAPVKLAAPRRTPSNAGKASPNVIATGMPSQQFGSMPKIGDAAPDFQLPDQHGHFITLSKLRGTKTVVYFYPKDDTTGCRIEAQGFSNDIAEFQKRGVVVLGISKDDTASHTAFTDKYGLKFQLLSDVSTGTIRKYGCWVEKNNYGRKYMGTQRATFLIDEKGKIAKVWPNVTPEGHSKQILAAL
jgi:thioredoxin-dependent peroxiredoxin